MGAVGPVRPLTTPNTVYLCLTLDATHLAEYTSDRLREAIDVGLAEKLGL